MKGCQRKRNRQKKNRILTSWMSMKAPWVVNINEIEYLEETVVKLVSCQRRLPEIMKATKLPGLGTGRPLFT